MDIQFPFKGKADDVLDFWEATQGPNIFLVYEVHDRKKVSLQSFL